MFRQSSCAPLQIQQKLDDLAQGGLKAERAPDHSARKNMSTRNPGTPGLLERLKAGPVNCSASAPLSSGREKSGCAFSSAGKNCLLIQKAHPGRCAFSFSVPVKASIPIWPRLQSVNRVADIHGQINVPDFLIGLQIVQADRRR